MPDLIALKECRQKRQRLSGRPKTDADAVIDIECEIWIPAARPDVIREDNVARLKTKLVCRERTFRLPREAERILHKAGTLVIPDFIANAGGVICASVEYHGGTQIASATDYRREDFRQHRRGTGQCEEQRNPAAPSRNGIGGGADQEGDDLSKVTISRPTG